MASLPYGHIYRENTRNTRNPIISIVDNDDEILILQEVTEWFKVKVREAQYIQVAVSTSAFMIAKPSCEAIC